MHACSPRLVMAVFVIGAALASVPIAHSHSLAASSEDAALPVFEDAWVLPGGRGGRVLVSEDALAARLVAGHDLVQQGLPGTTELDSLPWSEASFSEGQVQHDQLRGGTVAAKIHCSKSQVLLLKAQGHSFAYHNDRPLAGDPYGYGFVALPVYLEQGDHWFLFRRCRGNRVRASFLPAATSAEIVRQDATLPDLVEGERDSITAGILIRNPTLKWWRAGQLRARIEGAEPFEQALPAIAPLTVCKVAVSCAPPTELSADKATLAVDLVVDDATLSTAEFHLRRRPAGDTIRRTFVSKIDNSVQYYTLRPGSEEVRKNQNAALFLSLHGAGVESQGQAACYTAKDWGNVVAPNNRRKFGFDWEDWGRHDALEVLELACAELQPDLQRLYVTGHSMGGHGTWQLGALFPDRFAAIAPSAGWISFSSYTSSIPESSEDPIERLLLRAGNSSNTLAFLPNLQQLGIYVLHGGRDNNVPVSEARRMREELGRVHANFAYFEQPGAGHWWGNKCMDWPPLFDYLQNNRLAEPARVQSVDFVTCSPSVSPRCHWVSVLSQNQWWDFSRIQLKLDRKSGQFEGSSNNVQRLALDVAAAFAAAEEPPESVLIRLDDQELGPWPLSDVLAAPLQLLKTAQGWQRAAEAEPFEKGPHRAGLFKETLTNQVLLVVGTQGSEDENRWALNKARFDAETFWYRGNGALEIVLDRDFDHSSDPDRNVILYGNEVCNSAWSAVLDEQCPFHIDDQSLAVGERRIEGEDLCLLATFPRRGSHRALVGVVAGTGASGQRTANTLPIFVSGVGVPDWVVLSSSIHSSGLAGIAGAGFLDHRWRPDPAQSAWRDGVGP